MVGSFLAQDRLREDRLIVFGDVWEGEEWIKGLEPEVTFYTRPKAPYYGHAHLVEGMGMVETTHYTLQDDDNAYVHGGFKEVRGVLTHVPLVTGFMNWYGKPCTVTQGPVTGRDCVGGWQTWLPREIPLPDLTYLSDSQAIRNLRTPLTYRFDLHPNLIRTDLASEEVLRKWVVR